MSGWINIHLSVFLIFTIEKRKMEEKNGSYIFKYEIF